MQLLTVEKTSFRVSDTRVMSIFNWVGWYHIILTLLGYIMPKSDFLFVQAIVLCLCK